ncbi:hypothetical protein Tco_0318086 [Tanacetum coccineum]
MAETMEQYMSKTRTDNGLGVARPKIDNKDQFELKGQFLKELRENTFSGSDNEDANEHIEKVLEIVDLFHDPNITQEPDESLYQAWERFKELSMKCPQYCLTEMQEVILFYNGLDVPTRQILDSRRGGYRATAPGYYQMNNANPLYQEQRQSMEDTLRKFMSESAKRHEENSNLIKEIQAATDAAIRNQGASIKTLEIQIGQMSKVLQERGFRSLPSSTETKPRDQVKLISTTIEANSHPIRRIGSYQYAVSTGQNKAYGASHINDTIPQKEKTPRSELAHTKLTVELADRTVKYLKGIAENVLVRIGKLTSPIDFIILDMPEDIKVPLILGRSFLSIARAKIDVYKRKITLRVGEEKIIFKSVKPASSLIKRVYMLSLRERMELDLESRLIRETLVLNRFLTGR